MIELASSLVRPTYQAGTWNTLNSLSIELLYDQLLNPHKYATPTLRLLMSNMKRDELGPDMKFGWNIITKNYSPSIANKAQSFLTPGLDNITRMEYEPSMMYNSAGSNDIDMALYKSDNARMDFIDTMIDSMNQGYTDAFGYEIFSTWNEDTPGDVVDISAALSRNPNPPIDLTLSNVTAMNKRIFSIPMLIRNAVYGHTLANIPVTPTTNYWWQPTIQDQAAAVVTRSSTGDNVDCVTGVENAQPVDIDDFSEFFDLMQVGWHYGINVAVGSGIYRQLVAMLLAITRRDIASPLGELGIKASIEWEDYNAIFYKDPMMTWLHPYSVFAWDPECMWLMSDSRFDPSMGTGIYPWEHIPGSTMQATAMYHITQLITPDRRGLGAMHGYTNS